MSWDSDLQLVPVLMRWQRQWLMLMLVGLSCACSSDQTAGQLYLQRLAGALDQTPPALFRNTHQLTLAPRAAELTLARTEHKISVLDLIDVHRCQLGPLVAARNGSLGRVQHASQRFIYDVALVAGLSSCQTSSPALQELYLERKAELPLSRFNAVFAGAEWHDFVTPPVAPVASAVDQDALARQLGQLRAALTLPASVASLAPLESLLGGLRFSRALGRQRAIWRQQSLVLEAATQMLGRARQHNPGCRTGAPTETGRIRRRVFEMFYANGFQPELARQQQPDRGWLLQLGLLLEALLSGVPTSPQTQRVDAFHAEVLGQHPENEFGRWKTALEAHTSAWQWQLTACGLMPGANAVKPPVSD